MSADTATANRLGTGGGAVELAAGRRAAAGRGVVSPAPNLGVPASQPRGVSAPLFFRGVLSFAVAFLEAPATIADTFPADGCWPAISTAEA